MIEGEGKGTKEMVSLGDFCFNFYFFYFLFLREARHCIELHLEAMNCSIV